MRRILSVSMIAAAMLCIAAPAHAYYTEDPSGAATSETPCETCHGTSAALAESEPYGPHANYTTTSNKCSACHSVHKAPAGGIVLLPAATVLATCETCHDGTGGVGVYGVIEARTGVAPAAEHTMLDTTVDPITSIPGGDGTSGGSRTAAFSGTAGGLTCTDCHSPHGASTVGAFTGDRARSGTSVPSATGNEIVSDRLLRQEPTGGLAAIDVYGSDWCGSCHAGRLSKTTLHNHPVDSEITQPDPASPYTYENIVYPDNTMGTLGYNNNGYVMPHPRTSNQNGHDPICQQCHEDARSVGDITAQTIDASEVFAITGVDGAVEGDNPRYQVFPHESDNPYFLVETDDDLCLNCHTQPRG
ncbi:MAG: hypothetical protein XD74_2083 [Actinobacteria bacterium 66_15]|nr:MAG: hypothetical protein XD74_2083 [Actinobacteria bacterium 66_15]